MHFHQRELESDMADHIREQNTGRLDGYSFRGLREGHIITIDGIDRKIVNRRLDGFSTICIFADGSELASIDIHRMIDNGAATMREDENFIYLGLF